MSIVQHRRRESQTCTICGKRFTTYPNAKFCSNACKQRDKYRRNKEKKDILPPDKKSVDTNK